MFGPEWKDITDDTAIETGHTYKMTITFTSSATAVERLNANMMQAVNEAFSAVSQGLDKHYISLVKLHPMVPTTDGEYSVDVEFEAKEREAYSGGSRPVSAVGIISLTAAAITAIIKALWAVRWAILVLVVAYKVLLTFGERATTWFFGDSTDPNRGIAPADYVTFSLGAVAGYALYHMVTSRRKSKDESS